MIDIRSVAVPPQMARLPRDARGYPIPFNVYRDIHGTAHFTINDEDKRRQCITKGLCPICGLKLIHGKLWFVGGPLSAFHERGAYNDPPMHRECAHYALKVCPYLALSCYRKRIEDGTLPDDDLTPMLDLTQLPDHPHVFVCGMVKRFTLNKHYQIIPTRPFRRVEYWRDGARLPKGEGQSLSDAALQETIVDPGPPRLILRGERP